MVNAYCTKLSVHRGMLRWSTCYACSVVRDRGTGKYRDVGLHTPYTSRVSRLCCTRNDTVLQFELAKAKRRVRKRRLHVRCQK